MFYNIIQSKFKRNINNCWFASALCMYSNNILKRQLSDEEMREIEQKAYDLYVMPQRGLTTLGGAKRVGEITKGKVLQCKRGSKLFHFYLDKGYVIAVSIQLPQLFVDQWKSDLPITGGRDERKDLTSGHSLCIAKRDGKYYLINSRKDKVYKELESLDVPDLFKTRERCAVLLRN